ncbi:putative transporter [Limibacterium fermenti]|jgi:putative transport protein|uniref:putative transporter n=1 Tax=Limibacterium fermenti TaxID=3229863 RepID=UPI000E90CE10|nr:putative transporter [Porphyromonadaceae bacterium]
MEWLYSLLFEDGVAHSILLYAFIISAGVALGKIKIFGISLGVTFVLFVGLFIGHLGFTIHHDILHFVREFGLILFVFSIGLQVGPGFFSSLKKGGMKLNALAVTVVFLGVGVTIALYYLLDGRISMPMMVGILSGAVTNTPGLGAAQEALSQLASSGRAEEPIALGYAVAYPLGVTGIILSLLLIRFVFKVDLKKENREVSDTNDSQSEKIEFLTVKLTNKHFDGRKLHDIKALIGWNFIASRMMRDGHYSVPIGNTVLQQGDILFVITSKAAAEAVVAFLGETTELDWKESEKVLVSRRIIITQNNINGKTVSDLQFRSMLGVNVTRVHRSGIDLLAGPNLVLQVGDKVTVVGELDAIKKVEDILGNTLKRLDHPHIFSFFMGIVLGVLAGSIPFFVPGIPMPVKLGLAGGPLIVAILLARFGYKLKMVTYTTQSANLMLREMGIALFLASVGIGSGGQFVETVVSADGLLWIACGFIITIIPLLITGYIGKKVLNLNYFTLMGLLSGSMTDPPALAYANSLADNDAPAVAYSTVYPLTMFLRVISAQMLVLIFL